MNYSCLFCGASGKLTQVEICVGEDTEPDYLCRNCAFDYLLGGIWTRQQMKDYIHTHLEEGHVFIVYYNSETTCYDGIEGVHTTLAGAVEWIREQIAKNYDDRATLYDTSSSSKGVNMTGWSLGTYNIYRVPLCIKKTMWSNNRTLKVIPQTVTCIGTHGRLWEVPEITDVDRPQIVDGWIEVRGELESLGIQVREKSDGSQVGKSLGSQQYSKAYLEKICTRVTNVSIYKLDDMNFTLPKNATIFVEAKTTEEVLKNPDYTLILKYR